jgi:hypothetical protein
MDKNHQDLRLLPVHFKKIAFGIFTLSFLLFVLTISKVILIDEDIVKTISKTGVLISLLLLALTKNKIEDELTSRIRLKAFASSFIFGVAYVSVEPFVSLLFKDGFLSDKGVIEVLITMFLFYFIIFYYLLKKR